MTDKQPEVLRLADFLMERQSHLGAGRFSMRDEDELRAWDAYKKAAAELRRLHEVNAELVEALKSERALRVIGQHPDVHWESLRDMRRSVYAATDAALAKAEGREA